MVLKRSASTTASTTASGGGGGDAAFAIGAKVEVRSNDVGFKGSWYEATIIRAHPRRRAYDVDYLTLVDDADPSQPLRETARASLIRPRAPRLAAGTRYAVNELVDAYHNDGWWPGIVSAAHGGDPPGRYTISFPGSREVLEFAASEIRPHLDWRYGQWFPPQNQSGAVFGVGAHVELSGDKDNYGAVWLLATVIKVLTNNIYLVEYKKHKRDGTDELLREFVDAQYVRPVPRSTPEGIMQFALHELIEAWHCGGWMLGVVSKIVDVSKYIVKLMYGGEEKIELSHSEMRRHRDWINGQWVHGPRRRGRPSTGKKADRPLLVSSSSSGEIEQTNITSLKRQMTEGPKSEAQVDSLVPSKLLKKGDPSDQLWMEIDPKTPNGETEGHAAMQDFESPPIRLVVGSLHVEAGLQENILCDGLRVEQRLPKCNSTTELVVSGEEPSNSTEKMLNTRSVNSSVSICKIGDYVLPTEWGTSKGVRGPRVSVMKRTKKLAVRERRLQDVFHDVRKHSNAEVKRKRGRPAKRSTKSIISMNIACKKVQHPKRTSDQAVKNTETSKGGNQFNRGVSNYVSCGIRSPTCQDGVGVCENPPLKLDDKDVSNNVTSKGANRSNLGVSKDVSSGIRLPTDQDELRMCENSSLDVKDVSDNNASKTKANKPAGILVGDDFISQGGTPASFYTDKLHEISGWLNDTAIEVEYRALSSPLKEGFAAARSNLNGSRVDETSSFGSMCGTGGNEAERTIRQSRSNKNQTSNLSPSNMVLIDPTAIASSLAKTPPFVKSSLLWKSIETMEVFHIMPQEPHFRLLEQQCGREFREGMALGLMVTFANLESDVKKFDMFDSQDAFEDRLKALKQLEDNGFNVQNLRSRIDELLEIRNSVGEFQSKKTILQEQISERENEKGQIDLAKLVVDRDIKEVEKHLARLFEKRDSLVEQERNFEAEITELEKNVQVTEEAYRCAEQQFNSVAASPW